MKKSFFKISSIFAFLCINMSSSFSMDNFWNSFARDEMLAGEALEKEIREFNSQFVDKEFIREESYSEKLMRCPVSKAPSLSPSLNDFCQYLEESMNAGGNDENITKFLHLINTNSIFQKKIGREIMENNYATIYINYLCQYSEYK